MRRITRNTASLKRCPLTLFITAVAERTALATKGSEQFGILPSPHITSEQIYFTPFINGTAGYVDKRDKIIYLVINTATIKSKMVVDTFESVRCMQLQTYPANSVGALMNGLSRCSLVIRAKLHMPASREHPLDVDFSG